MHKIQRNEVSYALRIKISKVNYSINYRTVFDGIRWDGRYGDGRTDGRISAVSLVDTVNVLLIIFAALATAELLLQGSFWGIKTGRKPVMWQTSYLFFPL